jgi:hypothetical protein
MVGVLDRAHPLAARDALADQLGYERGFSTS